MRNLLLTLTGALVLVGCDGVPSAYKGRFEDNSMSIEISSREVKYRALPMRKPITLKLAELKIDDLLKEKAAAYYANLGQKSTVEVFIVIPTAKTRQTSEGFVWYNAEITLAGMDPSVKDKKDLPSIPVQTCKDGLVQIDTVTKQVQLGCPESAQDLVLVRSK